MAKVLEFQLQHQSFQWIFRTDFLYDLLVWSPCNPRDSQESCLTPQFKSINSSVLSFLYGPTLTFIHDYWKKHTGSWVGFSNRLKSRRHSTKCLVSLNMCVCVHFSPMQKQKEKETDTKKARRLEKLEIKTASANFHPFKTINYHIWFF